MSREEWREIPGYMGRYRVSSLGRVQSQALGPWRDLAQKEDPEGYMYVGLIHPRTKARKTPRVHRLVLRVFVGPCPEGQCARHLNGRPGDNRLSNLAWGTMAENHRDKVWHGTFGDKLKPEDAEQIRELRAKGVSVRRLAERFDLCESTVSKILRGEHWKMAGGPVLKAQKKHGKRMSKAQIRAMREAWEGGEPLLAIARRMDVSPTTVRKHTRPGQNAPWFRQP